MVRIVVVGSLNYDTTTFVSHLPQPGETVLGSRTTSDTGGKGANQAVAAARMGADVAMVGRIGDDDAGRALLEVLERENVDSSSIVVDASAPTGSAFIMVDEIGENMIVVNSGANATLASTDLPLAEIGSADVVMAQLESPVDVVTRAAELCRGTFMLNPAPAQPLPAALLDLVDILVPNRSELGVLADIPTPTTPDALARAVGLVGVARTVVTLGGDGAFVAVDGHYTHIPAPAVGAVDPTAAGDAFCGALAAAVGKGMGIVEAARLAVVAGAVTVTRVGAQSALPTLADVEAFDG
ncbi:MAG: ribokinase [Acidimicrobiia bacterium]|nr:ribokinase [Acidimicrobiia bacterium]